MVIRILNFWGMKKKIKGEARGFAVENCEK